MLTDLLEQPKEPRRGNISSSPAAPGAGPGGGVGFGISQVVLRFGQARPDMSSSPFCRTEAAQSRGVGAAVEGEVATVIQALPLARQNDFRF